MARTPSKRPFAASKPQNIKSQNPKTIQNRAYRLAKRGLELAEHRDDNAFRTSKSRALKKLRTSTGWVDMSIEEQEKTEEEMIRQLEAKRDAKKQEHAKEWFHKVENDDIESDEDDIKVNTMTKADDEDRDEGTDDEWWTDDSDCGDDGVTGAEHWHCRDPDFMNGINEIKKRYGIAFIEGLKKAEKKATMEVKEAQRY